MDMIELFRTLRKRWLLTALLLLLALTGTAFLALRPGPYQAESQVTLLPSRQASRPAGYNPYLALDASLTLTADLLRREVTDPRTAQVLAGQGYPDSYQIVDDPSTAGPVLDITVLGSNKAVVEHTLQGVTAEIPVKLAEMQASVKQVNQIGSLAVSVYPTAKLLTTKKLRLPVVVFALGLVFTAAIPQTVEASAISRRSRKAAGVAAGDPLPASGDEDDDTYPGIVRERSAEHLRGSERGAERSRGKAERAPGKTEAKAKDFDYLYE